MTQFVTRETLDAAIKAIIDSTTTRTDAIVQSTQEALDRRDRRIADLEARLPSEASRAAKPRVRVRAA